jgi:alpha-1,6-mannosyltransferase
MPTPRPDRATRLPAGLVRRPRWTRRPAAQIRRSALVLAVVAIALAAHAVNLVASRAINLDGSHSSLAPASPGRVSLDLAIYTAANAVLVATYVALLVLALRGRIRGLGRTVVLVAPVVLQVVLLAQRPWLSTDVLSYIAQGFVAIGSGAGSAYTDLPRDVLGTTVGAQLTALGWRPQAILSPYGPLWTAVEVGVMSITRDVGTAILLVKLPAFLASLGSAALIWRILGRVRPELRLVGTVAFLWSPVVLVELAAEGHVDGLMVLFVLLAVTATLSGRPVRAGAAGALAVVTKYLPVIFVPAQAVFLWRTAADPERVRRRLVVAAAVGGGIAVAVFAPFWAGPRTLDGLRVMGQPGPWPTLTGVVYRFFERMTPGLDAGLIATVLVGGAFAVFLARAALSVRDDVSLLRALAVTAIAFVLVGSPVFYPWYAVLPIALVALAPETPYLVLIVAVTTVSRLVAPFVDLRSTFDPVPAAAYTFTLLGLLACLAIGVAMALRAVWAWAAAPEEGAGETSVATG